MPAVLASMDILTASDSTDHTTVHEANNDNETPIKHQLATMDDY